MKAVIASALMRLLASTWIVNIIGILPDRPSVVVFWHGVMLPVWKVFSVRAPAALVSASKDGALLTQLLSDWKYTVVRGSSSSGGSEALDTMVHLAHENIVMVTPDGPRGPAHVCKPGAVVAAFRAQVPIIVVRVQISRAKIFHRSWDAFTLPMPFARITIHIDAPITQPVDGRGLATREEIDAMIRHVQHRLNAEVS